MPNNTDKGKKGEEISMAFLEKNGYKVLHKNWRHQHLEIDVVACINNTLVIVEVKLRANDYFGNPAEFVTKAKQKKIIKAANAYIVENNIFWETRFDVISIIENTEPPIIEHIIDAFYPTSI